MIVFATAWLGWWATFADTTQTPLTLGIFDTVGLQPDAIQNVALCSVLMMVAGLFVCLTDGGSQGGMYLRMAGLSGAAFLWLVLGTGLCLKGYEAPTAAASLGWGIVAMGVLIRCPTLPGNRTR